MTFPSRPQSPVSTLCPMFRLSKVPAVVWRWSVGFLLGKQPISSLLDTLSRFNCLPSIGIDRRVLPFPVHSLCSPPSGQIYELQCDIGGSRGQCEHISELRVSHTYSTGGETTAALHTFTPVTHKHIDIEHTFNTHTHRRTRTHTANILRQYPLI